MVPRRSDLTFRKNPILHVPLSAYGPQHPDEQGAILLHVPFRDAIDLKD